MGGVIDAILAVIEFLQARHIRRHVAIGGRDDAGGPFHHMVASEQCAGFVQRVANMVAGVAGCGDGFQRPALAADPFAIGQYTVWGVIGVKGTVSAGAVIL